MKRRVKEMIPQIKTIYSFLMHSLFDTSNFIFRACRYFVGLEAKGILFSF
jgi:hypothetical protein